MSEQADVPANEMIILKIWKHFKGIVKAFLNL